MTNENEESGYECRDNDGVINPLLLENWQMDLDNAVAVLSTDYFN